MSTAGWIPASELAQLLERQRELVARAGEDLRHGGRIGCRASTWASRSASESETRRCWAPSWRFRSSRRRSSSPAATIRPRDARISSSWRRCSVTSSPAATMLSTAPGSSWIGAPRQMIERVSPRAFVKVFSYSAGPMLGRGGAEARDHRPALAGIDEDVPEVPALDLRGGREAARLDGRRVEAADPSVRVDGREQARRGAHHGEQRSFCIRSSAWSRSLSSANATAAAYALDQLGLAAERLVMEERGDPAPSRSTTVIA